MTSRHHVEAALWTAGMRDPVAVRRVLRVIDEYAFALAHDYFRRQGWSPPVPIAMSHGGGNPDAMVTCRICGKCAPGEGNFRRRASSRTGYKLTCLVCEAKIICVTCGQPRRREEYDADSPSCIMCVADLIGSMGLTETG